MDYEDVKGIPQFTCCLMRAWGVMFSDVVDCDYPEDTWDDAEDRIVACQWGDGDPSVGQFVDAYCARRKQWLQVSATVTFGPPALVFFSPGYFSKLFSRATNSKCRPR